MITTRRQQIFLALKDKDKERLTNLKLPPYDSTKGTDSAEREVAVNKWEAAFKDAQSTSNGMWLQPDDAVIAANADADISEGDDSDYIPSPAVTSDSDVESSAEISGNVVSSEKENSKSVMEVNSILKVETVKKKDDGRRFWNQKNYCIFCNTLVTNFNRHLERRHGNETQVAKALASPKQRKQLLTVLRKKGNFLYNKNVLREKQGALLVGRRPSNNASPDDYLPCSECFTFFKRHKLYKHSKLCRSKKGITSAKKNMIQSKGATLAMDIDPKFEHLNSKVISSMNVDPISTAVKCDTLICQFGSRCLNKSTERHSKTFISARMRELGRLLLDLRKKHGSSSDLKSFLQPQKYLSVVESVKNISGYDKDTGIYGIPSLATKLGHSLRQCAQILECEGLTTQNQELVEASRNFLVVLDSNWQYDISCRALKSIDQKRWNKPSMLPLAKDIQALNKYIRDMEVSCKKELSQSVPTEQTWRCLNEVTLAHIILLNRRRSGEVQRIKLESYLNLSNQSEQQEIYEGLSETEKMLTTKLLRLEIRGKRSRMVPVLFTPSIKESLDILVNNRENCNVLQSNPFLFAIPNTTESCIRGSDVLRKLARICGAEAPHFLTSTKLRKHVATVAQILNMNYKDLEQLAKFMGHDINVHSNFYRLPDQTVQVAKLGKLFLALERGNISKFKGKSIDQIDINIGNDEESSSDTDSDNENAFAEGTIKELCTTSTSTVNEPKPCSIKEKQSKKSLQTNASNKKRARKTKGRRPFDGSSSDGEEIQAVTKHSRNKMRKIEETSSQKAEENFNGSSSDGEEIQALTKHSRNKMRKIEETSSQKAEENFNGSSSDGEEILKATKSSRKRMPKMRKTSMRKPWSKEEKDAVMKHLHKNILLNKVPSKSECERCKDHEPILNSRSWRNIKDWVYNAIKKN